jgi:hypothetical protein
VGALRPLKFVRHLPSLGWRPVVLCDHPAGAGAGMARRLLDAVPADVEVIADWSAGALQRRKAWAHGGAPPPGPGPRRAPGGLKALAARIEALLPASSVEWVPLGEHLRDMPHALAAGRRLLADRPDLRAIVVNADPWAALVVGARLAEESGLPLICDLRDPWSVCELRRPLRPLPQRLLVDRLEAWVVARAHRVLLNTDTTRDDYRRHYPEVSADRFQTLRNHGDADLPGQGGGPSWPGFTALFFGNFRRHVEGDVLLQALARLCGQGVGADRFRLVVTGSVTDHVRQEALRLGVADMLVEHPHVPYGEAGPFLRSVDLLVSLSNATRQRIPAKIFDYLTCPRPLLSIADSAELSGLLEGQPGVWCRGLTDVDGIADAMLEALARGRQAHHDRSALGLDSRTASRRLAGWLDEAMGAG